MSKIINREQALKNAFASARMEGFKVTPETIHHSERLLSGDINTNDLIAELSRRRAASKDIR